MDDTPTTPPSDWGLGDWESALTIRVGTTYVCRQCENIVMVTRGGVGVLELTCCGEPMEEIEIDAADAEEGES